MQCPRCGKRRCYKIGGKDFADGTYQMWRCKDCKKIIKGQKIEEVKKK